MKGIIAVDFDGTLCEDNFPHIGNPNISLINSLIARKAEGERIILWTCRTGKELKAAVDFCSCYGLRFDAVNNNLPEIIERYGGDSRKIYADIYIDDKACLPYWKSTQEEEEYERKEKYA